MKALVLSVGGSLISKENPDTVFLKRVADFLVLLSKNRQVAIVVGGGLTCRKYITAASELGVGEFGRDVIGIEATALNATLVREILGDYAYGMVLRDPTKKVSTKKVLVCSGWKPGWSTDYVAVRLAKTLGTNTVVNISNQDFVYDKDPKIPGAKPLEKLTWLEMKNIVGDKWTPGFNAPFDPVACKSAEAYKMQVICVNGNNLQEIQNFLQGKPFRGTLIN